MHVVGCVLRTTPAWPDMHLQLWGLYAQIEIDLVSRGSNTCTLQCTCIELLRLRCKAQALAEDRRVLHKTNTS